MLRYATRQEQRPLSAAIDQANIPALPCSFRSVLSTAAVAEEFVKLGLADAR